MITRRAFLENILKTSGAVAVSVALANEGLLALPSDTHFPLGTWTWDGTMLHLTERLNELVAEQLHARRLSLLHAPDLTRCGETQGAMLAQWQVNWGTRLSDAFLIGQAGTGALAPRGGTTDGMMALFHRADPVASLPIIATDFADRIEALKADCYGDLIMPQGVAHAQSGMFRCVSDYVLTEDETVLRFDLLLGARY